MVAGTGPAFPTKRDFVRDHEIRGDLAALLECSANVTELRFGDNVVVSHRAKGWQVHYTRRNGEHVVDFETGETGYQGNQDMLIRPYTHSIAEAISAAEKLVRIAG